MRHMSGLEAAQTAEYSSVGKLQLLHRLHGILDTLRTDQASKSIGK